MGVENDQYFFIFGALVAALFIFASITYLTDLFEFEQARRTVMIDSYQLLFESMDSSRGMVVSGVLDPSDRVTFEDGSLQLDETEGLSLVSRPLLLREDVEGEFSFSSKSRIVSHVDSSTISFSLQPVPECESSSLSLSDISSDGDVEVVGLREDSLASPVTMVLVATIDRFCDFEGLSSNYDLQAYVLAPESLDRFTDKEVLVVVI